MSRLAEGRGRHQRRMSRRPQGRAGQRRGPGKSRSHCFGNSCFSQAGVPSPRSPALCARSGFGEGSEGGGRTAGAPLGLSEVLSMGISSSQQSLTVQVLGQKSWAGDREAGRGTARRVWKARWHLCRGAIWSHRVERTRCVCGSLRGRCCSFSRRK